MNNTFLLEAGLGRNLLVLLVVFGLVSGCSSYGQRVAPVPLPATQKNHLDIQGAKILAQPYADADEAKAALGFDIRGSGLLPVRLVIDNQSNKTVKVVPSQTFLIDKAGQAWPLLTAAQAYERVKGHVEIGETAKGAAKPAILLGAAGALAGLAVGIITGDNIGESAGKGAVIGGTAGALIGSAKRYDELDARISDDLASESLSNARIRRGELAYGYLFFPGKDEAESASGLRIAIDVGGQRQIEYLNF